MDRHEYIFAAISIYIDGYIKIMMSTTDGCGGIVDWNQNQKAHAEEQMRNYGII